MSGLRWTPEQLDTYTNRLAGLIERAPRPLHTSPRQPKAIPEKTSPTKAKPGSKIEELLAQQISTVGLPAPVREYRHIPGRKYRLDFAWPDRLIAVEVQGMVHRIKERFEADIEKRAESLLAGWTVLEVSGASIRDGRAIGWIEKLLRRQREAA